MSNYAIVCVGSKKESFCIEDLEKLSYFKALFSKRWENSKNETYSEIITIFDDSTNKDCNFTMKDLQLLLKCVKIGKIPIDLKPNCNTLELRIN